MKYLQVKQAVLSELLQGHLELPLSEHALAARFQVSRMTARRALQELAQEGYVKRQQGRRSEPQVRRFSQGFLKIRPFYAFAEEQQARPGTRLLLAEQAPCPPEVAKQLGVSEAITIRRLRLLDEEPVLLETRYLHPRCAAVLEHDLSVESIHDLLLHELGFPLSRVWQRLEAIALPPLEAQLLQSPPRVPALCLERVTYALEEPLTWGEYLIRGDRYYFEETFSPQEPE